jgi:hypothetical protein
MVVTTTVFVVLIVATFVFVTIILIYLEAFLAAVIIQP